MSARLRSLGGPPLKGGVFDRLLDIVLPAKGGTVVVLEAYFDASSRPSGIFCVAGYAFAKQHVKKFDKEWWALFGSYGGCHMADLAARAGQFEGIDQAESVRLIKSAVQIINRRISYGVTVSCDLAEINTLLPTRIDGFQHAYPVCCHLAMTQLGGHVATSGDDEIAYFFENGDEFQAAAHRFMGRTGDTPELRRSYRYHSHSFIPKEDALALQAADILAWEWTKYYDETVSRRMRPMRRSLVALLSRNRDLDKTRYAVNHITGAPLRKFAQEVAALGVLEIAEMQASKRPNP